jgi:septal ring factor EnvC (AmiA/AmiB activator)
MLSAQIAALQKEVGAAENVRSFAAETEREIAQLQRDLKDARGKIATTTMERDRLASELKDVRDRDDTNTVARDAPKVPRGDVEPTKTGTQMPILVAEHLTVIEEAVESLRANMRAASDETAMLKSSPSVSAIEDAISAAAEHVERARQAIKQMHAVLDEK